jgi:hypothetical protein
VCGIGNAVLGCAGCYWLVLVRMSSAMVSVSVGRCQLASCVANANCMTRSKPQPLHPQNDAKPKTANEEYLFSQSRQKEEGKLRPRLVGGGGGEE